MFTDIKKSKYRVHTYKYDLNFRAYLVVININFCEAYIFEFICHFLKKKKKKSWTSITLVQDDQITTNSYIDEWL